ncbi:MAG: Triosephosphate isomerase [Candidatus Bipolaricaulis sibiricus]|uniref:Triosephosphate isomerase n=1 Tax=Bipolaricaulis sibiricus TaxID=2501609 RepID=A0A410FVN4_BIPS1|nr:MAG: Triosephosphate isomerase [Candidatus Bipolaricaulis sibiricus]
MRRPIVAANWKMHKTLSEARVYLERLIELVGADLEVEVVVLPSFTALSAAGEVLRGAPIALGAQNAHPEKSGAFTGEVSVSQLADLGVRYVLCGHSERRQLFGEHDTLVGRKVQAVADHGMMPILCVGETLEERTAGRVWEVVERQLDLGLASVGNDPDGLVIAYEPVWAIGTGVAAQPADAQEMAARIRGWLRDRFGSAGEGICIQYGGSVKPDNAGEFLSLPDLDGALVGGASLDPDAFWAIVQSARR